MIGEKIDSHKLKLRITHIVCPRNQYLNIFLISITNFKHKYKISSMEIGEKGK